MAGQLSRLRHISEVADAFHASQNRTSNPALNTQERERLAVAVAQSMASSFNPPGQTPREQIYTMHHKDGFPDGARVIVLVTVLAALDQDAHMLSAIALSDYLSGKQQFHSVVLDSIKAVFATNSKIIT